MTYTLIQWRVIDLRMALNDTYKRCTEAYCKGSPEDYFLWRRIRGEYIQISKDLCQCDGEYSYYVATLDEWNKKLYERPIGDYFEMRYYDSEMRKLLSV